MNGTPKKFISSPLPPTPTKNRNSPREASPLLSPKIKKAWKF